MPDQAINSGIKQLALIGIASGFSTKKLVKREDVLVSKKVRIHFITFSELGYTFQNGFAKVFNTNVAFFTSANFYETEYISTFNVCIACCPLKLYLVYFGRHTNLFIIAQHALVLIPQQRQGYIKGRFRSYNMIDLEAEYRFVNKQNDLVGGVVFTNAESFSDVPTGKYEVISPGAGLGICIMLNNFQEQISSSNMPWRTQVSLGYFVISERSSGPQAENFFTAHFIYL